MTEELTPNQLALLNQGGEHFAKNMKRSKRFERLSFIPWIISTVTLPLSIYTGVHANYQAAWMWACIAALALAFMGLFKEIRHLFYVWGITKASQFVRMACVDETDKV